MEYLIIIYILLILYDIFNNEELYEKIWSVNRSET
jgi:hypothetical protein